MFLRLTGQLYENGILLNDSDEAHECDGTLHESDGLSQFRRLCCLHLLSSLTDKLPRGPDKAVISLCGCEQRVSGDER